MVTETIDVMKAIESEKCLRVNEKRTLCKKCLRVPLIKKATKKSKIDRFLQK